MNLVGQWLRIDAYDKFIGDFGNITLDISLASSAKGKGQNSQLLA